MFIGDGAKLVRDAFKLAKEKAPAIIFIDELDAIGTKRFDSDKSGDREVQRTMLELLNQLDGFSSDERIKARQHVCLTAVLLICRPGHRGNKSYRHS
jgi:26S proteasome regulatory subunit T5